MLVIVGVVGGAALLYGALFVLQPLIDKYYGLFIPLNAPTSYELLLLGGIIMAGILAGLLPAVRAYRLSLSDGMMVRV